MTQNVKLAPFPLRVFLFFAALDKWAPNPVPKISCVPGFSLVCGPSPFKIPPPSSLKKKEKGKFIARRRHLTFAFFVGGKRRYKQKNNLFRAILRPLKSLDVYKNGFYECYFFLFFSSPLSFCSNRPRVTYCSLYTKDFFLLFRRAQKVRFTT